MSTGTYKLQINAYECEICNHLPPPNHFQPAKLKPAVPSRQKSNWYVAAYRLRRVFMALPQAMTWISMLFTAASW
jgi:hypothetical protein